MIQHVVLFRFQPGTAAERIVRLGDELRALEEKIPVVLGLQCGRNFSDRSQGYEFGLTVQVEDRHALEVYRDHPAHRHVVEHHIRPIAADLLAVDFES